MQDIEFGPLLTHLHGTERGGFIANLSVQTKVEKFLLAEMAFAAATIYPDFELWLEESPRRDLTIRHRTDSGRGPLFEWLEAKMCYSDCVARTITKCGNVDEYCNKVVRDVKKQDETLLPPIDESARRAAVLFVLHRSDPHKRHIYYPNFGNRKQLMSEEVRQEAIRFCNENISCATGRTLEEQVDVRLNYNTELLGFFYRRSKVT